MNTVLLSLLLAFTNGPAEEPVDSDRTAEARGLFLEGTTLFESADYDGAIEKFTEALALVSEQGGDAHVRLTLLYNIATAHERAFKIDHDVKHLRQALMLYEKYRDFAQEEGDRDEELEKLDKKIDGLEGKLRVADNIERNRAEGPSEPPPPPPLDAETAVDWKKPRNMGIGLVVGGGAMTIGGVVLAVLGSTFEGNAQDQVNKLADQGVPADHPAWDEGDDFIASEKRRGTIFMSVGGSVAVVGAVGVGVGSYYLVKSKRLREGRVSATPTLAPGFAGVQISGRF